MRVLGISAFYHDSAAAILEDGEIVAAAQEERFTRKKHDARFPADAVDYCLREAGVSLDGVDYIAFYDKPLLKFERLLETYLSFAPRGFESFSMAIPVWLREKLFLKDLLVGELKKRGSRKDLADRLMFSEHHLSHAASAFFPSPFKDAAVLTMDGVGEWATTSLAHGHGNKLEVLREIHFPHSLGLLYSAFTYYTGFKVNSGEYKVMGLAPYGEPKYAQLILDHLIDLKPDGTFRLDLEYFNYCTGLTMTNGRFDELFGGVPRKPEARLTQREMDLAASIQAVTEEVDAPAGPLDRRRDGASELMPRWRSGIELRRERQGIPRRGLQGYLDSACRRGCGRGTRSGAGGLSPLQGPATAGSQWVGRFHERGVSRAEPSASRSVRRDCATREPASRFLVTKRSSMPALVIWPRDALWHGFKGAWSSGRARWVRVRSWEMRDPRPCSRCSTSR